MLHLAVQWELRGLYLIGDFKPPVKPNCTIVLNRLKNTRQLTLAFNNLTNFMGKNIIFLNTRSLKKHESKIVNDQWYQRGDILIFAETRLKPN